MSDEITFDVVKNWLSANKDADGVPNFLATIAPVPKVTSSVVKEFLSTPEGKEVLTPFMKSYADSRVTEAIKTHDVNWEAKVNEEVLKKTDARVKELYPELNEEPWKKEMREMKLQQEKDRAEYLASLQKAEADKQAEKLKADIVSLANEKKIDPWLTKKVKVSTLDEATELFSDYESWVKAHDEKIKNELIANNSFKPNGGKQPEGSGTKLDAANMSEADWIKVIEAGELNATLEKLK